MSHTPERHRTAHREPAGGHEDLFSSNGGLAPQVTAIFGIFGAVSGILALVLNGFGAGTFQWPTAVVFLIIICLHAALLTFHRRTIQLTIVGLVVLTSTGLSSEIFFSMNDGARYAIVFSTSWCAGALVLVNKFSWRAYAMVGAALLFFPYLLSAIFPEADITNAVNLGAAVMLWLIVVAVGRFEANRRDDAARIIRSVHNARRAEVASRVLDARRREDSRILHDTALSTLSLLAHGGRGVPEDDLRKVADADITLLRSLLTGVMAKNVHNTDLAHLIKQFGSRGIHIHQFGAHEIMLTPERLATLLLALHECFENIRRHAHVDEAELTIENSPNRVYAVVTDRGIGYAVDGVLPERLGIRESITARIEAIGGKVLASSTIGHGTTILLEVPR